MSKGLEALENITGCSTIESHTQKWQEDYHIVEKSLKALEIIKAIGVFDVYNDIGGIYYLETRVNEVGLTKDNYDLLKEVLYD